MRELINKIKYILIKFRDHVYNDYGITPEGMHKFLTTLYNIVQCIFIIIIVPLTIIGLTGSLFVLGLVYPFFTLIYLLFSITILFYALFRDKLDEKYQIL